MIERPAWLFDRHWEWQRLTGFLDGRLGTRLAIVYGRRRQGKTALTRAWCEAAGGFHWEAAEVEAAQNLDALGRAWSAFAGNGASIRFATWDDAVRQLVVAGALTSRSQPIPVVIDEFNRIVDRVPEVASYLQRALAPGTPAHLDGRTRLTLCGSAFGAMRRLLDGPAALRGRAALELIIEPFDFRTASDFWGLGANPNVAFELHALIGGTPAYLELANDDSPTDGNLDAWAARRLLDPSSALHREGRIVVAEDAALGDRQLYWGLLAAIADGHRRWSDIERALAGSRGSLKHALDVALEAGWVARRDDPLRANRPLYELTEPIVRLQRLVIEPSAPRIASRHQTDLIWNDLRPVVTGRIFGPHLETLARSWARDFAEPTTLGGVAHTVGSSTIKGHQLDLVVTEQGSRGTPRVVAIGEVKASSDRVGRGELERLDSISHELPGVAANDHVRRLLVARSGFTSELMRVAATRRDVELVDLHRLYGGT